MEKAKGTGTGVQEFRSSGVQEFRSSGVQEFRSSGVQEFRSSGVQEFRSSGVQSFALIGDCKLLGWDCIRAMNLNFEAVFAATTTDTITLPHSGNS